MTFTTPLPDLAVELHHVLGRYRPRMHEEPELDGGELLVARDAYQSIRTFLPAEKNNG